MEYVGSKLYQLDMALRVKQLKAMHQTALLAFEEEIQNEWINLVTSDNLSDEQFYEIATNEIFYIQVCNEFKELVNTESFFRY